MHRNVYHYGFIGKRLVCLVIFDCCSPNVESICHDHNNLYTYKIHYEHIKIWKLLNHLTNINMSSVSDWVENFVCRCSEPSVNDVSVWILSRISVEFLPSLSISAIVLYNSSMYHYKICWILKVYLYEWSYSVSSTRCCTQQKPILNVTQPIASMSFN